MQNELNKIPESHFFRASASDFKHIPGFPIAYWVGEKLRNAFKATKLGDVSIAKQGLATGDNDQFLRYWYEVSFNSIEINNSSIQMSKAMNGRWVPYSKGGTFRKWYGNNDYVVKWLDGGNEIRNFKDVDGNERSRFRAAEYYFKCAITWSLTSSNSFGCRYRPTGYVFDINGMSLFPGEDKDTGKILALLNSKVAKQILTILNPSMAFQIGDIAAIPAKFPKFEKKIEDNCIEENVAVFYAKNDWDAFEISWDFKKHPLLLQRNYLMSKAFQFFSNEWQLITRTIKKLEEENNRIFIEEYSLQNEITSDVHLKEITLTCNPHYRYGGENTEEELEAKLLADTMKEFISYSVGCMFGRYSLDKPGLILANQGETVEDYRKQIPNSSFPADEDNVIPILDGDWFTDDITGRFFEFLKVTFGSENYEENLKFIESAIGKTIRKYFLNDFYNDHVRRYKKRPIYWLFSSPKGSFNALIYMHRYRPDTVSVLLNDYLREYRNKLVARKSYLEGLSISGSASKSEKVKSFKEIENMKKMIDELETYEREIIYPLATEQIKIDLDDGVKVNYLKFGEALKKIPGLEAKEEE